MTQQKFPAAAIHIGKKPVWRTRLKGVYVLKMEGGDLSACPGGKQRSTVVSTPDNSAQLKIIFLISEPKYMLWVLHNLNKRVFQHQKHMFKLTGKKIAVNTILHSKSFLCKPIR